MGGKFRALQRGRSNVDFMCLSCSAMPRSDPTGFVDCTPCECPIKSNSVCSAIYNMNTTLCVSENIAHGGRKTTTTSCHQRSLSGVSYNPLNAPTMKRLFVDLLTFFELIIVRASQGKGKDWVPISDHHMFRKPYLHLSHRGTQELRHQDSLLISTSLSLSMQMRRNHDE